MDEQRKDRTDVDARQGQSAAKGRAPWQRPQWRKLDAGEAAVNVAGSADVSTIFS
jgi:hypothetical protein